MRNRTLRVAPVLVLLVIAYGCGVADTSPTAPQQLLETGDAGGASFGTTGNNGKKAPKITICHRANDHKFVMITISENAWPAHVEHGDVFPDENGNCPVISEDFVTFIEISAVGWGEGATVTWTVDGTTDPVTYYVQGRFGTDPWEDSGGSSPVAGTGVGTYSTVDYYGYDEYRVRAVDGNGNEVFSPGAVVQY